MALYNHAGSASHISLLAHGSRSYMHAKQIELHALHANTRTGAQVKFVRMYVYDY